MGSTDIREHETRSFLVLPLLLALGWSEQQIKIELGVKGERKRIDIACFARAYRRDSSGELNYEDCTLIIETKDFRLGLEEAPDQAKAYAEHFPLAGLSLYPMGIATRHMNVNAPPVMAVGKTGTWCFEC